MSPEHVGSTHLRFDDARVIGKFCTWLPNVVRSPGCDLVRHQEFQNGPEVKIYNGKSRLDTGSVLGVIGNLPGPPEGFGGPPGGATNPKGLRGSSVGRDQPLDGFWGAAKRGGEREAHQYGP